MPIALPFSMPITTRRHPRFADYNDMRVLGCVKNNQGLLF